MNQELLQYLCCPKCRSDLVKQGNFLICKNCGARYEIIENNIVKITSDFTPDLKLSIRKWDEFYQKQMRDNSYIKKRNDYIENFFEDGYRQINEYKRINKDVVYLGIGCGLGSKNLIRKRN